MFPKQYADSVARLRVTTGFVLVAAFAWFSHPSIRSLYFGFPICVLGLLLRGWAAGHLSKNQRLAMSGPYAYTRNPLYLGTALVAAGLVAASRSWWLGALFAAVFVFIYLPAIQLEQQHLSNLFPEYREYAARVPMLWPKLGGAERGQGFDFALYGRNREYQALYGFLAGAAYLIWKAVSAA